MIIFVWISMLIFFAAYLYFWVEIVGGRWKMQTKWSELTLKQWLTFAGLFQITILLSAMLIIAVLRS